MCLLLGVTHLDSPALYPYLANFLDSLNLFPLLVTPIEAYSLRVIDSGLSPRIKYFSSGNAVNV